MATIAYIEKRIAGKEKEIATLEKKIERIRKAEASGWENNPYEYTESDLKWALKDLESAQAGLEKYRRDLEIANEKADSRNVPAILEFLTQWKARCTEFYLKGLQEYYEEYNKLQELYAKAKDIRDTESREACAIAEKIFRLKRSGYFETTKTENRGRTYTQRKKIKDGEYEYLKPYCDEKTLEAALAKLKVDLDADADKKYDFIIERTTAMIGKIVDASGLHVGDKGDLNGIIIGEKGKVRVQTVGAGGYNIQCFHFRTLINKVA